MTKITKMTKVAVLLFATLPAGLAVAGYKEPPGFGSVTIYAKAASGNLSAARNSANKDEFIGCSVHSQVGKAPYASCRAQDAEGKQVECGTYDPELVANARSLNGDSAVYFSWVDPGDCDTITVSNYSYYEPKNP
jgi:hypothetical protein